MKKICLVTGSRAEWGLLSRLAAAIRDDRELQLQVIATNMHLSERYGLTYKEIEAGGFAIDYKVPMDNGGDSSGDTIRAMSLAMSGFASAYEQLQPDMLVVLGDRYEILVAVSAALIFKIPVAHLHGGEITEGAYDDSIRHAITKMSHLHFTSTEQYRQRVIQLGEQPQTVFNVGALGVDNILQIPLWDKQHTQDSLDGFVIDNNTILATYHPVTLENNSAVDQMNALLGAFNEIPHLRVIFTMPNSDTGNHIISAMITNWCDNNQHRAIHFNSLGLQRYLSTLQYVHAVVGNSSSGIIEVPSFGIPTLNIGDRQKGRIAATSVINCKAEKSCILEKLILILCESSTPTVINPYKSTSGSTVEKIIRVLRSHTPKIQKSFHDVTI